MTRACLFSLCAFSTLLHVWPASAACVASSRSDGQLVGYDYIKINLVGMNSTTTANFQKGMDQWNASSCNTDGMSFLILCLSFRGLAWIACELSPPLFTWGSILTMTGRAAVLRGMTSLCSKKLKSRTGRQLNVRQRQSLLIPLLMS